MALTDQEVELVKRMNQHELLKNAQSMDLASLVESNFRLKKSNEKLTLWLIIFTVALFILELVKYLYGPCQH